MKRKTVSKFLLRKRSRINSSLQQIINSKRKVKIDKCPICRSRVDNTVEVPIYYLEDKIQCFIDYLNLSKHEVRKLENKKYMFLVKIVKDTK